MWSLPNINQIEIDLEIQVEIKQFDFSLSGLIMVHERPQT